MLRVKPKLPGAKTRSRRFPDATGGMDSGFSSCGAPAFCRSPGISKIGRYMRVLQVAGKLQGRRMRQEGFRRHVKTNNGVCESQAASGGGSTARWKTQVVHRQRVTVEVELKLIYELRKHT